jgi:hypothetical protein
MKGLFSHTSKYKKNLFFPNSLFTSHLPSQSVVRCTHFEKKTGERKKTIDIANTCHSTQLILFAINHTLASRDFSEKEKQKFVSLGVNLFHNYSHRENSQRKAPSFIRSFSSTNNKKFNHASIDNCDEDEDISSYEIDSTPAKISFLGDSTQQASYRVTFRGGNPRDRKNFKEKRFIMPISIGQAVHENGRMLGTLTLIDRSFNSGIILVDDLIQWRTKNIFHPELSDDSLKDLCLQDGDIWLKRYKPHIEKIMTVDHKIMRWAEFLAHEKFEERHQRVKQLRAKNSAYHEAFDRNINEYVGRLFQRCSGLDYNHAYNQCLAYLEEECAVMTLWPEIADIEVYPSNRNHAMQMTNELIIKPLYGRSLDHTGLRFQKRSEQQDVVKSENTRNNDSDINPKFS